MKNLIIVRHAKSDWSTPGQADLERPLNRRGRQNAPVMAEKCIETCTRPDILISSIAKRAKKTAKIFAEKLGMEGRIEFEEKIYKVINVRDVVAVL